ncbi:MAG: leucyl aminopeptidase family protein [Phycisphaerales bacterium]
MFSSIKTARARGSVDVLVVGVFGADGALARFDEATRSVLVGAGLWEAAQGAAARPEATGECCSIVEGFAAGRKGARVLVVSLGKKEKLDSNVLRNVAAAVGRRAIVIKAGAVRVELGGALAARKFDAAVAGQAFGEGLGILGWVCDQFRGKATTLPKRPALVVSTGDEDFRGGVDRGLALAEGVNIARTLSQTPPNIATPYFMAEQAQKVARRAGLSCRVFREGDLVREEFEGLINVGKASENKPCMIRLEYTPRGGGGGRPVVLIGKTMTYDTGGLSLKVNNGMVGMKRDKDGGCAVLGAMHAIATVIKPRKRVVAYLAAAENSLSDEAYRPDDVLTYRNGVTVEVTNTDAEGRLVLADALAYACEKDRPACIVDLATLTGGVVVALGSTYCGMFCEDDGLRKRIEEASASSGERVWRLPMHEEYREMMKSPIADILNSNPNRKAHPIQGAAFLSYFVKEEVPWCHLDIAGVHAVEKNAGMFIEGPTGWGVRILSHLLDQ